MSEAEGVGDGASTSGMKGEGYYDLHSEYQRRIIEGGDELIHESAGELELGADRPVVTIADYGAGTGATSVHAIRTALRALRERDRERPVMAVHNDVLSNDFTQVFRNVGGPDGYLALGGGPVYPVAAAGSFFNEVLPSGTVDLGLCSNAAHWFRDQPSEPIEGGIYQADATGKARRNLTARAASDWLDFLRCRVAELSPGGCFLVQGIGAVAAADGEKVSATRLLAAMSRVAGDLAREGLLDSELLSRYVFPVYCRSLDEVCAPAAPGGSLADTIEISSTAVEEVPNPYWEAYERDGDGDAYAEVYVQFVRAFAESTLTAHLFEPGAISIEPSELCEQYFKRLETTIAADPEASRYEAWVTRVSFRRTGSPRRATN